MADVTTGKRYLSDVEKAQIFLKSDFWQDCLNTGFAKWGGSQDAFQNEIFKVGSRANVAYHNVLEAEIQALEKSSDPAAKTAAATADKTSSDDKVKQDFTPDRGVGMSVFSQQTYEKEQKQISNSDN